MKKQLILFLTIAGLLIGAGITSAQRLPKLSKDAMKVAQSNNEFAYDLYRQLKEKDGNLFFSPYSISNALAMTYAGARGETATQMANVLHFNLPERSFHPAFGELVHFFNAGGAKRPFELSVANRLWGQKDFGFKPAFLRLTKAQYAAGLQELDFIRATGAARKTINAWVEKQTNNKIKDLIKPNVLKKSTRMVLTNAIYFKSSWMRKFNDKATKKGDFTFSSGGKTKVPLMHKRETLMYVDQGDFKAVRIPYKRYALSMFVLLPKKADGLAQVEKVLTGADVDKLFKKMKRHSVDLKLPKFKVTSEFNLKKQLSRLGMKIPFSNKADFSGMTTEERLKIDEVIHKAFVDVHEKGTEAAAATAVVMVKTSAIVNPPPRANFHVNRPFLFVIRENRTGSVLFMGRVVNPGK